MYTKEIGKYREVLIAYLHRGILRRTHNDKSGIMCGAWLGDSLRPLVPGHFVALLLSPRRTRCSLFIHTQVTQNAIQ
ncbi:Hypothetical predicted protein [Marmota monax]|uniref:Uncharacterized protein n=1 Tax=Marmota monax TaxID=9995 RepID=A0A5E4A4A4_MARMO|nr:hypothetical protein GHT09_006415 [Marmota monax]VTJ52070.1 Hypothetical predicted protein [Marmota monax]